MTIELIPFIISIAIVCAIIVTYESLHYAHRSYYFKLYCALILKETLPVKTRIIKIADKIFGNKNIR